MTLALYRKYRPRTFAEVIGQEHVTEPLSQALRSGRLNHAYLFSGPRGCGKTSSARILARSLNCEQGPTPEPCGQCDSCRSLATDGSGSIDVIEIDAASHGGVDDARELREKAFFAPARSRFKIYVIDEAHMVSSAGFNALLKLVEEPPEYVKFIFATTEPEKVLGTIKSRTHHYPFRLIPPKTLRPYLEQLCEAEGVTVDPAVFPLVVRAGGGSARDSLSVLDQLIAGAGPEGVTYPRAAALLGVTDSGLLDEMCDALAAGDGAAAYATVDRVAEAGHDARRFASDLLERLRDLIVLQQVPDAAAKGLIDGPADQIERMTAQAQRLGPATLSRCADIVHDGLVAMRGTTAPRLLLELICARMLLPGADDSTGGLLQRLERMERRLTLGAVDLPPAAAGSAPVATAPAVRPEPTAPPAAAAAHPAPAAASAAPATAPVPLAAPPSVAAAAAAPVSAGPAPAAPAPAVPRREVPPEAVMPDPATPAPPRPGAAAAGALDAVAVRRSWPEVVGKVNRTNKRIAALMRDAVVRELDGDALVLTVKSTVLAKMMSDHAAVLTDALYEEFGGRWQIRCEVSGERGGASLGGGSRGPAPAPPRPAPAPPAPPASAAHAPATNARPSTGAAPGPTGGGGVAPAGGAAGADEEWPEPARPGGAAAPAASAPAGDDWPEAARPGGSAPAAPPATAPPGGPTPAAAAPATSPNGTAHGAAGNGAAPATPANGAAARGAAPAAPSNGAAPGGRAPAAGSGLAAARAAAAGRGARTQNGARKTADADWAGEPPYDPDYDGPVRGGGRPGPAASATPTYEGFDPGDEPLDEVIDERTARQSSEEQAVQLLREAFGAEKIDEVDAR
ncbi:DNA polymerase III subunit gamma and tau [Micromonospora haikouensis]|uniref:DNA polymerase III subunit gamma/tau n=1 Tax=Micromonospora haikouensis TaxID=686309 RepID=A0A0D0WVK7_9ACTN|nr:DNA polymerase III subunit gamma and tau [Micromonospora haikouensis]KIR62639.1 DNA polymerase III subunit gamma/tau [Micromonospora haikouensis]